MSKREFQPTEGLLEDVMRKQAGSIEKAVLEGVMNSVDAGASFVNIELDTETLLIEDDGRGMSEEEVENYFEMFGLKDSDIEDKEFGKFRMGRGQIFSFGRNVWHTNDKLLVVDLDHEETMIRVDSNPMQLDTSGLSYNIVDVDESYDGCSIAVDLYDEIDDVSDKVGDIVNLIQYIPWLHDVDIEVNGEEVTREIDPDAEAENAFIEFDRDQYSDRSVIFNKGAYVKRERLGPVYSVVITKNDLDLNFARNDILSGDDVWQAVQQEYNEALKEHLITEKDLSTSEANWLVRQASDDRELYEKIKDIPLFQDVDDSRYSMEDLEGERVTFSNGNDKLASDVMRRTDVIVLHKDHKAAFDTDDSTVEKVDYSEVVDDEMKFEMDSYSEDNMSKRRQENLEKLRWALGELGYPYDVVSGVSKHSNVWMTDAETLMLDKDFLNANKTELATTVLLEAAKESAYRCDTRTEVDKDHSYRRRFINLMSNFDEVQQKLMVGHEDVDKHMELYL